MPPRKKSGLLPEWARGAELRDLYHSLVEVPWPVLFAVIVVAYLVVNGVFALAYLAAGDAIENARPGSFADAFFFSVQTFTTVGYGGMQPKGTLGNVLVTIEALFGWMGFAVTTGLVFAKFAQPTARVLFSRVAVVSQRDGQPSLMFRVANKRANRIIEARLRVVLALDRSTEEGESVRSLHDLALVRSESPLFGLTWTVVHPIDESSPLREETAESLERKEAEIIVVLTGLDETLSLTIHTRHAYGVRDIVWNAHFVDVLTEQPDGRREVDMRRFHDVERA